MYHPVLTFLKRAELTPAEELAEKVRPGVVAQRSAEASAPSAPASPAPVDPTALGAGKLPPSVLSGDAPASAGSALSGAFGPASLGVGGLPTITGSFDQFPGKPNTPVKSVAPDLTTKELPKRNQPVGGTVSSVPAPSRSGTGVNASPVSRQGGSLGGPTVDARHAGSGRPFGPSVAPSNLTGMDMALPGRMAGQSDAAFGRQTSNWAKATMGPGTNNRWSEDWTTYRNGSRSKELMGGSMKSQQNGQNINVDGGTATASLHRSAANPSRTDLNSTYGGGSITFGDKPSTGDPRLRQEIAGIKSNQQALGTQEAQQFAQQQFNKNPGAFGRPDMQPMSASPRAMQEYSKTFPVQNATPTPPRGAGPSNGPVPVNPAAGFVAADNPMHHAPGAAPANPAGPTPIAGTNKPAPGPAAVSPAPAVAAAKPATPTPAAKPAGPAAVAPIPKT